MPHPIRQAETDACPGALRLHSAADGPLARIRLPGGRVTGPQLAELARLAAESGDGHLELTSRANVQLRALTRTNSTDLAARLATAGLLPAPSHETVRNIAAPPLADRPIQALVRELDAALCADPALTALPGRFLFALGTVPLVPDVSAVPAGDEFAILFAAADEGLRVPAGRVVTALLTAAHAFLAARGTVKPAWRVAELAGGTRPIAERTAAELGIPLRDAPALGPVFPASPVGVLPQPDGLVAVGSIVPLGRLTGVQLELLAEADQLVVTPGVGSSWPIFGRRRPPAGSAASPRPVSRPRPTPAGPA
ncbi:hypothetical protein [Paractinoplanes durhamensis]|uniref:hypothetical protein n=1 Tax=Paractinoplanes durhamensis TaxID=113563 RepID=UPI003637E742